MNMLKKMKSENNPSQEKQAVPFLKKSGVKKAIGLALIAMSTSVFVQGIPLLYVFIGAYLGVPADAEMNMDTMVWLLTSLTMMLLAVYTFLKWTKYLVYTFLKKAPTPAPPLALAKKAKHTHA